VDHDLWKSLAGFPGLATMLPVMLSEGVNKNRITLERVSEVCSYNTARIFGMYPKKGTIKCGSDADLTIVDMEKEQIVTPDLLQSYSDYTIYDGWKLRGWPIMTIVRGKIVMENGDVDPLSIGYGEHVTTEGT
jgi:dihydropyrimidinase